MKKAKNLGAVTHTHTHTHTGTLKNSKGITLIALVITIMIILILTVIVINIAVNNNGLVNKVSEAVALQKRGQYFEEIQLENLEEQMERAIEAKNVPFIESMKERLEGSPEGSNNKYVKKAWIRSVENNLDEQLIITTEDNYELVVDVDNENNTLTVIEDSYQPLLSEYTVSFNSNGANGSIEPMQANRGVYIELPETNTLTKTGYTCVGWYKNDSGTGKRYNQTEEYRVNVNETLYAKWSDNAITITYDAGDGTGTQMSSSAVQVGDEANLLKNKYTKAGYKFAGWKDQNNNTYTNTQNITASENLTLTAQWTLEEYVIEYNLDGGTVATVNPTTYTIETNDFTLTNPIKEGYNFVGWSGTGLEGDKNTTVTITQGSTGNKTYTANYELKPASVSVTLKNGTNVDLTSSNISNYIGEEVEYSCNGGGTWRIFYLDVSDETYPNGKYGDCIEKPYTLYLKRDADGNASVNYKIGANESMKDGLTKFNPLLSNIYPNGYIGSRSYQICSYLCCSANWSNYCNSSIANYAIGSPSLEMYVDAYNQYKGKKTGSTSPLGYDVSGNSYRIYQNSSIVNSIPNFESTRNNVFGGYSNNIQILIASPKSGDDAVYCFNVDNNNNRLSYIYNGNAYRCGPIVSLK